jgi:phage gp36-like protein
MRSRIPAELKALPQWVCCRPDKVPLNAHTGYRASPTDASTWGTFEQALSTQLWIGFVLSADDPYTVIDLDDKGNLTREQQDVHARILSAFSDTYIERSINGRGFHIWCRGSVSEAIKRDSVEVYSRDRYIICTGDVAADNAIVDKQALLTQLVGEMRPPAPSTFVDQSASLADDDIWRMASTAANASKFVGLCDGDWQALGYPSQSEADEALLSILAFYSKSNEQCIRMFRQTALANRAKAARNDYLERTLRKVRSTEIPPVDLSALTSPINAALPVNQAKAFARPPGLVGDIADYIYATAVRPVPEIALAGAIALVAGVSGRSYNISSTGLNQYIIVLAPTGTGKEGAAQGVDKLVTAVRQIVPSIDTFIGPRTFASGQGLSRVLEHQSCFVSFLGEFGLTLQQICDPQPSSAELALRQMLLDLYSKSGWAQLLRTVAYSDRDKNVKEVQAPAVTIFGESTPETFFDNLSATHVASGLIPRFSVIEYRGPRPPRNLHQPPPPKDLVDRFAQLAAVALASQQNRTCLPVSIADDAQTLLNSFDAKADAAINDASGEIDRQLWNRAHLKALKLAALLAVGENQHYPLVTATHAEWAVDFVTRDVEGMVTHYTSGSVGVGDHRLNHEVREAFAAYLGMSPKQRAVTYKIPRALLEVPIAPYSYFARRLQRLAPFQQDHRGANKAIVDTLNSLVADGTLAKVPPQQAASQFGSTVALYYAGEGW